MDKELFIGVSSFAGTELKNVTSFRPESRGCFDFEECRWEYQFSCRPNASIIDYACNFKLTSSTAKQCRVFAEFKFAHYDRDAFVFMPSAAYDGNNFEMIDKNVWPLRFGNDIFPQDPMNPGITVRAIPSVNAGFNRMVTDASTPLIAFFSKKQQQAFFLFCEQDTVLGNNAFEAKIDGDCFELMLSCPTVRRKEHPGLKILPAPDIAEGTQISFKFQTHQIVCRDFKEFYQYFFAIRKSFGKQPSFNNVISFSRTKELIIGNLNEVRWNEEFCFYRKIRGKDSFDVGHTGFVEIAPLISDGDEQTRQRALKHLETVLASQLDSGFFSSGTVKDGKLVHSYRFFDEGQAIVRDNGEMLYTLTKLLNLLNKLNIAYPASWDDSCLRLAEALHRLWEKYGQFGFLIDVLKAEIIIGSSSNGVATPAGLILAGQYFKRDDFIEIAKAAATQYYQRDLCERGFTYGGPADVCLTPDSESAFGFLESLITLYEYSGERIWLERAEHCAHLCASWTPSHAYNFRKGSTFDQLKIDCRGAVQANLQNQHGAPGICTFSGNSLLKLYRASGKVEYLEMLRDIAHNITQYFSSPERPILIRPTGENLPFGEASEKVRFQDFHDQVGEISSAGGWVEMACLLSCVENPGIYYQPDSNYLLVLDHVEAQAINRKLHIKNVFDREIEVKVFIENSDDTKLPLGDLAHLNFIKVKLAPGASTNLAL
jgi:hypothetical protein